MSMMMMMIFPDNTIKYNFFVGGGCGVVSDFWMMTLNIFFLSIYRSKHFWQYFFLCTDSATLRNIFNSSPPFFRNTLKQRIFIEK